MAESQSRNSQFDVSPKYAEIVVIRHGETEWNAERRIQGQLDVALNGSGRQQAFAVSDAIFCSVFVLTEFDKIDEFVTTCDLLKLAGRLSSLSKVDAVYSSDLKRAFNTAEIIAEGCGVLEVISDPDLRERHLGDLQGVLFDEAPHVNPQAFTSDQNDLEIPGGGESYNQLYNRCTLALQRIAKKHIGERVVVVSHGATIEALYTRARPSEDCRGKVLNASINVLHLFDGEEEWSVKSWGDVTHLNIDTNST